MDMKQEIKFINQIIYDAVKHGGDAGGPYYSDQYSLTKALTNWLEFKEYNKFYDVDMQDDYSRIVDIETAKQHEQGLRCEKEF